MDVLRDPNGQMTVFGGRDTWIIADSTGTITFVDQYADVVDIYEQIEAVLDAR